MTQFLTFRPIYQERVWGGRGLEQYLGRTLPALSRIGESWELVDRPEAQSIVVGGIRAGATLRQLIETDPEEIMGPGWPKERPFPILVKWLDCRDRLSVQVHPPASLALRLRSEPKTENWYFGLCNANAAVYAGLKAGVTTESFAQAIADGTVATCLDRLAVRDGDSLLIPSGTMHAIDAGNVILEIQQNSDTTYRVFDWGRLGLDGKPRTLHVTESLECVRTNPAKAPGLVHSTDQNDNLAICPEFTIRRERLAEGDQISFKAGVQPRILSVVRGELATAQAESPRLKLGVNALLPYGGISTFVAKSDAEVLVTENFCGI